MPALNDLDLSSPEKQEDGKFHPIAFASRALCQAERNYSITDLETLAVVWGIPHFHTYLYGQSTLITQLLRLCFRILTPADDMLGGGLEYMVQVLKK
jgi:hypothetical protein